MIINKKILKPIYIGLIINLILASTKIVIGLLGNTQALFSDGLNSLSDVFISIVMLIGLKISSKAPDENHPYGHEKFEGISYFILSIVFFLTSFYILYSSINLMVNPDLNIEPESYTVIVSLITILPKLFLFFYYLKVSKKIDSPVLKADAKNHLLDVFSTLLVFIGIFLSQFGFLIFDYIASLIIGILMFKLAFDTAKEAISFLTDQAPNIETIELIREVILKNTKVIAIDDLKVRMHMTKIYVDVEIGVDKKLSLEDAHKIAEKVHLKVEEEIKEVIHCMVHVNPK